MLRRAPETSLYTTVKTYLERLGYVAKGKVCGCDVVAVRPGKPPLLVVTELKMGFTLEFLPHGIPPAWPSHLIPARAGERDNVRCACRAPAPLKKGRRETQDHRGEAGRQAGRHLLVGTQPSYPVSPLRRLTLKPSPDP